MNELAILFKRLDINTQEVLEAASTKWNFMPFEPGLVGGHCIGVDPYYLTYKAQKVGFHSDVILSGRRINDSMHTFIGHEVIKILSKRGCFFNHAKIGILGVTFKENCPDIRNSKVFDLISVLTDVGLTVELYDPFADPDLVEREYGYQLTSWHALNDMQAFIVAVAHDEFKRIKAEDFASRLTGASAVFDIKRLYQRKDFSSSEIALWQL